jgi:hypothetical protein
MSVAWGCEGPAAMSETARREIENGVMYVYEQCLVRYVPKSIYKFLEVYDYITRFNGAMPAYEDASPRFLKACRYYESKLQEFRKEVMQNG